MDFSLIMAAVEVITDPEVLAERSRMFGIDMQLVWQVIPQLFNVILLFVVLTKLLYKPVSNALQKRTDRIEGQLAQAAEELEKANALREDYESKIEAIDREREEILSEARKLAQETSNRLISDAKKEADSIRERAAASVEMEWERAENEMRTAIIDVSAVMAEKFVSLAINKETHDKLFDETMSDLEGMSWRD